MDINKLTQKSREAVQDAQALTIEYGNTQIEQAHLLYALLAQENGLIPQMLTKMEIDPEAVKADAQQAVSRLPKVSGPGREPDKVYISQDVDRALNAAQNQADHMTDEYISVEHLMLGLMETADSNLKTIFQRHNLTKEKFLEALKTVRGNTRVTSDTPRTPMTRSRNTARTWSPWPAPTSWTRSSAATRRSATSSASSRARRRTTPA